MSSISTEVSPKTIRSFALIVGGALLAIAAFRWWRHGAQNISLVLAAIAAVLVLLALIAPAVLRPVYRGWMLLGEALGWINTRIILTVVFFLVVTPIGLLLRLFGRSPMAARGGDSYWIDVEPHSYGDKHVEKQF